MSSLIQNYMLFHHVKQAAPPPTKLKYCNKSTLGVVLSSRYTTFSEAKSSMTCILKEQEKHDEPIWTNYGKRSLQVGSFLTSLVILVTVE